MKALSLWQPWAQAVALGVKCWETRSWPTAYRGPIAIHAAAKYSAASFENFRCDWDLRQAVRWPVDGSTFELLNSVEFSALLPRGAIVAVAELVHVVSVEECIPCPVQLKLGDYSPGRFVWALENIRRLDEPIPFRGRQRLFNVPDSVVACASNQGPSEGTSE